MPMPNCSQVLRVLHFMMTQDVLDSAEEIVLDPLSAAFDSFLLSSPECTPTRAQQFKHVSSPADQLARAFDEHVAAAGA